MRWIISLAIGGRSEIRDAGRLTVRGPSYQRRESREGGVKPWNFQNTAVRVEGLLSGILVSFVPEARLDIDHVPDPSASMIHPGSEQLWAENAVGFLGRTFSDFNHCHRYAEYNQQRHRGHIRILKSRSLTLIGVAPYQRVLTVMTLLNAPGCRPEFHLRQLNRS